MRNPITIVFAILTQFGHAQDTIGTPPDEWALIRYHSRFNMDFERGQSFREFQSVLHSYGRISDFYMMPLPGQTSGTSGIELLAEADTVFRVIKEHDEGILLFSDIGLDGRVRHYRDTLYPMEWKLLPESRWIEGIECQKAVTFFKGRSYTAWFAPSIPLGNGPWKLGGLPGLIVEAYEEGMDMHFILSEIRFLKAESTPTISHLHRMVIHGYDAFVKYWKDAFKVLQGSLGGRENPDCVSCHSDTKVKFYSWEKVDSL
jgi:hypothetical protein